MSAAPSLPPDYGQPEEPPRKPPYHWNWKRALAWVAAGIGILIVVLVVAVIVLLHSQSFHQYVLRVAEQKATTALGTQVQARDFALSFSGISPTLDLYNVVVQGAPPYANPPLLQADRLHVAVRVTSLFRRTWYLNDVQMDHPVVNLFVDKTGKDNLPQTKSSGQSQTNIFDLGVRHAALNRGEVYYNSRKSVIQADLHDLQFQSVFNPALREYSGTLGYRDGHLRVENYNPLPHNLQAQFAVTPTTFTLRRATLSSGRSQVTLTATVEDYANPKVQAVYDANLDAGEFRRIVKNASLPSGVIHVAGNLRYLSEPNRPFLDTVAVDGDLASRALQLRTPSFRGDIRDIVARYALNRGNLDVPDLRARLLGGELTGNFRMRNLSGASRSQLHAVLRGVSLAELKTLVQASSLQQVVLAGNLNATADAAWGKTTDDLVAHTDATINANVGANKPGGTQNTVPVNGVVHARYSAPTRQIALSQSYVRMPQTSLTLNGTVSTRSALQVRMQSNVLHELETVADMFRTAPPGQATPPLGLYGTALFVGSVRGSTSAPQVTGQLTAANLRVKGSTWRSMRTDVNLSPSLASLQNGELVPAGRGRITFSLSAGLRHWSFTEGSPVQVKLNASQLNVADLARLAGFETPVSGTLSANVSAHGTELNPIGQGNVTLRQAKVSGQPIQSANLNFQGSGDTVHANASVHLPAGVANAVLTYFPRQQGYDAQLQANGIRLDQLQAIKDRDMQLTGVLNLTASGRGTLRDPELQATAQIPQLNVRGQAISGITLQAAVANHVAKVALDSQVVMNTAVRARGTVNLTGNYDTEATFDTQTIPLAPLVAAYAPSQAGSITGQTELHGTLRGPLKNKALLDAHITIPTLAVNYKNAVQLGAASPIKIDYANGVLQLQRAVIRGTDTDLQLQASVPTNSTAPMSLLLLGTVDLRLAQIMDPDISSSGQVRFNINSYGQRSNPNVQGEVQIVNANVATGTVPIGLQNGNGVLTLTKDRLDITRFTGTVGGGTLTASGGVVYRPSMQFDLALAGRGIRLLYPDGVRSALDTNLALTGTTESSLLRGQLRIEQLQFTPDFDLLNFAGQFGGAESTPAPAQGFANNMKLDIAVNSSGGLNPVSRTMSLQMAANLNVRGTAAEPIVLGRVNLNGGDLLFNGNRYLLQDGTVDFVNASQTQPVLNVNVNTTIQQYNIHMRFEGPADHLLTNYTSDPALPPSDIISLIAFGKTTEASAANPMPGNLQAESAVASQVSGQVTNRVEKIAGISRLSLDPVMGCDQQNRGACVTIQQRVTSKIFVTFGTDVTQTGRETIKLEYQQSPRVSYSATRDQNGGFGFDTRFHKTW